MGTKPFHRAHPKAYGLMLQAVLAVLKQGRVSVAGSGVKCMYRGCDGAKCAVGHLIPDEKYVPEMDSAGNGLNVYALNERFPGVLPPELSSEDMIRKLGALQLWHDGMRFCEFAAPQWRAGAIKRLPAFIRAEDALEACKAQGIEVAA